MNIISIIIVNYNGGNYIKQCLISIYKFVEVEFEVIVVDNNSIDNSSFEIEKLLIEKNNFKLIALNENLGFAKANNIGAAASTGNIIHFLNPDTLLNSKQNFAYQIALTEKDENVIYVDSLTDINGIITPSKQVVPLFNNLIRYLVRKKKVYYWYTGASLIMHKAKFFAIGGWPEDYFMYAEDLDLFYRCQIYGATIVEVDTKIVHIGQASSQTTWSNLDRIIRTEKSLKKFILKYSNYFYYFLSRSILLLYQIINEPKKTILLFKIYFRAIRL